MTENAEELTIPEAFFDQMLQRDVYQLAFGQLKNRQEVKWASTEHLP